MGAADGSVYSKNRVTVGGYEIAYLRGGRGRPLVYLHGLGGGGRWESYHMALANDSLSFAPQLPGWPDWTLPAGLGSIQDYVHLVSGFLDAIEVEPVTLAGHSIGAWLALRLAVDQPGRVDRLLLADSLGLETPDSAAVDLGALDEEEFAKRLLAKLGMIATAQPYGFGAEFTNVRTSPEFDRQWRGRALAVSLLKGRYSDPNLIARLHEIACETLIVWGDRDGLAPPAHARLLRDSIPNSRLVLLEDTAHLPMVERREAFHRVCRDFLVGVREPVAGTVEA